MSAAWVLLHNQKVVQNAPTSKWTEMKRIFYIRLSPIHGSRLTHWYSLCGAGHIKCRHPSPHSTKQNHVHAYLMLLSTDLMATPSTTNMLYSNIYEYTSLFRSYGGALWWHLDQQHIIACILLLLLYIPYIYIYGLLYAIGICIHTLLKMKCWI